MRHQLGTGVSEDTVIYEDKDERFFLDVTRSSDSEYILIHSASKLVTEVRYINGNDSQHVVHMALTKQRGREVFLNHAHVCNTNVSDDSPLGLLLCSDQ